MSAPITDRVYVTYTMQILLFCMITVLFIFYIIVVDRQLMII